MKTLLPIYRTLSCIVAPAMIFFAVSGAWQSFRLHEDRRDGSCKAPAAVALLSDVHKAEKLTPAARPWFRATQLAFAAVFVGTALVGVMLALRVTKPAWLVWVWLFAGTVVPAFVAATAHR